MSEIDRSGEPLIGGHEPPPALPSLRRHARSFAALACILWLGLAALSLFAVRGLLEEQRATSLSAAEQQLALRAEGQAAAIDSWWQEFVRGARTLSEDRLLRLFAAELAVLPEAPALEDALRAQTPFMQRRLDLFREQQGLEAIALLGPDGDLLAGSAAQRLPAASRDAAASAVRRGTTPQSLGPRERSSGGPVLDVALALPPPDEGEATGGPPISTLLLSVPAERVLARLTAPVFGDPTLAAATTSWRSTTAGEPMILHAEAGGNVVRDAPSEGEAPPGGETVTASQPLASLGGEIIVTAPLEAALAGYRELRGRAFTLAGGGLALVAALLGFGWLALAHRHQAQLLEQYHGYADRLRAQWQLLSTITETMQESLALKDANGRYQFANRAFAALTTLPATAIPGLGDRELFASAEADHVSERDRRARVEAVFEAARPVPTPAGERYLETSAVPVPENALGVEAVVVVGRDVTELTHERARRERLARQINEVLVHTIELRDPYLLGHSRRLAAVAERLAEARGHDARDRELLRQAASLSQIGKTFIRRELLEKPERHSAEEQREMQAHIDHALAILEGLDFDLPVTRVLAQLHERLDGSGYPAGLAGDEIDPLARILAIADVFCARIAPRSYRDHIAPGEAIAILEANPERYDAEIVATLHRIFLDDIAPPEISTASNE